MVRTDNVEHYRKMLSQIRDEIYANRTRQEDRRQRLQQHEIEPEEQAGRLQMSQGLDELDEQEKDRVEAIHKALGKLESGGFGVCESCGGEISGRRLEAIPWTAYCITCSEALERQQTSAGERPSEPSEPAAKGFSDEQIEAMIRDELIRDGRVETEELRIKSKNGVVHLEGTLPGEASHEILRNIIEDILDFSDYEDRIRIDRIAWERRSRTAGRRKVERPDKEIMMEGEGANEEVHESQQTGVPLNPADRFVPEKEE